MSFLVDITKFCEKAKGNADAVVRLTVLEMHTRLLERSPVGDADYWKSKPPPGYVGGHYRTNWQIGMDVCPTAEIEGVESADITKTKGEAAVPKNAAGHVFYLANNVPYAIPIEDGHSWRQAPHGVAGLTAMEFGGIVNKKAGEVNK